MIHDEMEMKAKMDTLPIPMPDAGFEARLFDAVSAQPKALHAANDNSVGAFVKRNKFHVMCCGGALAAMLALAVSIDVSAMFAPDPMIGEMHMLADVEYMEEEQLFAGLDDMIY